MRGVGQKGMAVGFLTRAERKNSALVANIVRQIDPTKDAYIADVPCHIVDELHVGIRIDLPSGNQVFLHRCQLKWWARFLDATDSVHGSSPMELYRIGKHPAQLIDIPWKPQDAAMTIAASRLE